MAQGWLQVAIFVGVAIALTPPLGRYMARVFGGERVFLSPVLGPAERFTYRVLRVDPSEEHDWKAYAKSLVLFSVFSWIALYLILRTQKASTRGRGTSASTRRPHSSPTPTGSTTAAKRR
jgi:K+-transporting ATPase ATPase A chain